ncbi:wall-associated receptor kinase-like 21 [Brassica napus]|uniref:wall-associated receptor kinase-like 21 n=1 Tax=Brassica napus TaxID=3708 RepID=UPI0006AB6D5B|nr:wall-associated receptor kinase-like 21 [Brassica napus]
MDHTPYLIFLFFTLTVAAQTTGSVNCQTGYLPYPFGFTDGYPIRFNCSEKTDEAAIGEFAVAEVTNANIYVKIPPLCKRDIRKIEQLFRHNFAPSISQNTILVQGCNESSSDCSIGRSFVQDRLNLSSCISQVRCLDAATEIKADVMSVVDVVNRSGCKYWLSSITLQSKSQGSVNLLGQLRLDWWLKEGCSSTTCSANASCTTVNLGGGGFGHRCTCDDGFYGNAFIVHGGCRPVGKRKGLLLKVIVFGIAILLGASLIAILIFAFVYRHKRSASSSRTSLANRLFCELAGNSSVPFYTYKELEKATDNFSDKNKLGTGAYGTVYAGEFSNSSWVAIKRLRRKDTPSIDQVVNEIKLLSSVSHPNLVRLLGCCVAQGEPILVYEFMPNGTLSQHLQHERGHAPLSWPLRLSIASQTANAIAHLHSSVNPPIYHRDIKSSNILLDYEFNSKVSDFGLSRLGMSTDFDVSHISTAPQGTPGYLDPQYHQDFQLSDKSDVYSFGVVLIEIISGFKVIDFTRPFTEVNLAALAIDRIGRGRVVDIIDPSLQTENDPKMFASVQNLAELAFRCLSFHRNMRPTMIEVAEDIQRIKLMYFGKETRNSKKRSDIDIKRLNSK